MEIAFLDKIDIAEEARDIYYNSNLFNVLSIEFNENVDVSYFENVQLIVSRYTRIDETLLKKFPKLEFVVLASVTYRWVDLEYCKKRGISVSNCPTYNTASTAQFAVNLLFEITNASKIYSSKDIISRGDWHLGGYECIGFTGKEATVFGKGNIGSKIVSIIKSLGMKTTVFDSKSSEWEIDNSLPNFDYIFLAVPYNQNTIKLLNKKRIKSLKSDAIVISISAGEIIDEGALIEALEKKTIGGACLDSFCGEPFRKPSENLIKLSQLPNSIVTPHMAWNTDYSKRMLAKELLEVIRSCAEGKPINVVG